MECKLNQHVRQHVLKDPKQKETKESLYHF